MNKILWLCNIILPEFSGEYNVKPSYAGGWMPGLLVELVKAHKFEIALCFPIMDQERVHDGIHHNIKYYSMHVGKPWFPHKILVEKAEKVLVKSNPDIVHIWGTEFQHAYAMGEACRNRGIKLVIDIQGLDMAIGKMYTEGIPIYWKNLRMEGKTSIKEDQYNVLKNAEQEKKLIGLAKYVLGRTAWDRAYVSQVNPIAKYYHCNRVLRKEYYLSKRRWKYSSCDKATIFISQATYPLKGLHYVLESIQYIIGKFPHLKVKVGGSNSHVYDSQTPYGRYLLRIIKKYDIKDNIVFLGQLNVTQMIHEVICSNLFVSCSINENNSNSICEAMYLGTPVISSFVGGLSDILEHNKTGIFYPYNDVHMLAGCICAALENPEMLGRISVNARRTAAERHDKDKIVNRMLEIYGEIAEDE